LLKKREGEISEGKLPGIYFDKVQFDELAEDFLRDYRINQKKSLDRAELSVDHLKETFENNKVIDITSPRIENYIEKRLESGASNATINRELAALKRMFRLAAQQTPPKVNKIPHIPKLKENNVRKGFFEHNEFLALRDSLPSYLKGFVTFGYKTGWRVEEVAGLKWNKVDRKQGIVRLEVGETKNNEARTVYLDEELREVFRLQWLLRKSNKRLCSYVFPNESGIEKIVNYRKAWNTGCRKAKIGYGYRISKEYVEKWKDKFQTGPFFHDFRRTAVRNMVRSGIPERVAMMISGHKTRSVFDRYNIVNDADLQLAAQRQESYLKSQMGTISGTIHDFRAKKG
jgi:integrase